MKKLKKIIAAFLVAAVCMSAFLTVSAAPAAGDRLYVDTKTEAKNSKTGTQYRAYYSIDYLTSKTDNTVVYCIEPGQVFTRTYYKVTKASSDSYWKALKTNAKEGVALTAMFGFPSQSISAFGAASKGDAYAATQCIMWEYISGDRTNAKTLSGSKWKSDIVGTPAEAVYKNILSQISAYETDSRYEKNHFSNANLFVLSSAEGSTEQVILCYNGTKPVYPQIQRGNIEVYKKDQNGTKLAGAEFTIYDSNRKKVTGIKNPIVTDRNGYAATEKDKLEFGTYIVVETKFPAGHYAGENKTSWTVTLDKNTPNSTITINAVNDINPTIGTVATVNGEKEIGAAGVITLDDEVEYKNLIVGKTYTVKGVLMNKATGEELLENGEKITAETVFTPDKTDGTVTVTFTFDARLIKTDTDIVVFEKLYNRDIEIAAHTDIDDEGQTVKVKPVEIKTTATINGEKEITTCETITLEDVIEYKNLIVGKTYTVKGVLMNKATGEELLENGEKITAETVFIPETPDGTVTVTFTFNAKKVVREDTDIVVFEKLYNEDTEIAVHTDIEDEGQTVKVKPVVGSISVSYEEKTPNTLSQAGDSSRPYAYAMFLIVSLAGMVLLLFKKKVKAKGAVRSLCVLFAAVLLIGGALPAVAADPFVKTKEFTADSETVTTDFEKEISEDKQKYLLSDTDIKYEVVSKTPKKKTITTSVNLGETLTKNLSAERTLLKDNVSYTLKDISYSESVVTNRSTVTTAQVAYDLSTAPPEAPRSKSIDYLDNVTGQTVEGTLQLQRIECTTPAVWIKDVVIPIKFTVYNATYYVYDGLIIEPDAEAPALGEAKENILKALNLNTELYKINSFEWDGESYAENGIAYRNAIAYGERLAGKYTAYYSGTVQLPEADGFIGTANYTAEVDDTEKSIYTIKATADYELVKKSPAVPIAVGSGGVVAVVFILLAITRKNVIVRQSGKVVYKTKVSGGYAVIDRVIGKISEAGTVVIIKKSYTSKHLTDSVKITANGEILAEVPITERNDITVAL